MQPWLKARSKLSISRQCAEYERRNASGCCGATCQCAAGLAPEEGAEALEARTEVGVVDREGEPHHPRGGGSERVPGNHGGAAFHEKTLGECRRALRFAAD